MRQLAGAPIDSDVENRCGCRSRCLSCSGLRFESLKVGRCAEHFCADPSTTSHAATAARRCVIAAATRRAAEVHSVLPAFCAGRDRNIRLYLTSKSISKLKFQARRGSLPANPRLPRTNQFLCKESKACCQLAIGAAAAIGSLAFAGFGVLVG